MNNKLTNELNGVVDLMSKLRESQKTTSLLQALFDHEGEMIPFSAFDDVKLFKPIIIDDKGTTVWIVNRDEYKTSFMVKYGKDADIHIHEHEDFVETITLLEGKMTIVLKDHDKKPVEFNLKPECKKLIQANLLHGVKSQVEGSLMFSEWIRNK